MYKKGRVYVFHSDVFNGDAVNYSAVNALYRNARYTRFANANIFYMDILKTAVCFRSELNSVATAFNFAVPNLNIFANAEPIQSIRRLKENFSRIFAKQRKYIQ